ncbi:SAM-dependent methyltransferase [Streptosporangium sp. NPDC048047]|uniref:SAM-dependent methyltransferase n=1 Tax=Streptosporangium sp. NPDC048047 TaxID=3155748 RepID=UPI003418CA62
MSEQHCAQESHELRPHVPNVARMYDYFLGGKDNFAADRDAAEKIIAITREAGGDLRLLAREHRAFLGRVVRTLAGMGVRQYLDIGTGLPTKENVHEAAQQVTPDAHVVYVDNDPVVLVHARALLRDDRHTRIVEADLRDPAGIVDHPEVRAFIDFDRPVAVLLMAILPFITDEEDPGRIVRDLTARLPSGSHVAISHFCAAQTSPDLVQEAQNVYARTGPTGITLRSQEEILGLFDGLELLDPGVVPINAWRPDREEEAAPADFSRPSWLGGVARVP